VLKEEEEVGSLMRPLRIEGYISIMVCGWLTNVSTGGY
jgi:hypothetical protein